MKKPKEKQTDIKGEISFTYLPLAERNSIILERLDKITTEDGGIDFNKDLKLKYLLNMRAKRKGGTIADELKRLGYDYNSFISHRAPKVTRTLDEVKNDILACIDSRGNVVRLYDRSWSSYNYVKRYSEQHGITKSQAVNRILGVKENTYYMFDKPQSPKTAGNSTFDCEHPDIDGDQPGE